MPKQENFPSEQKPESEGREAETYISPEEAAELASHSLRERLEYEREDAKNEAYKNAAEMQAIKLEMLALKLLRRTGGNIEITNAINKFIDSLDHQAEFGRDDKQLGGVA